jgi:hypothetical protein
MGAATGWAGGGMAAPVGVEALLRRFLVTVAALAVVGTALELAMLRHWKPGAQLIPWVALALLAVGIGMLATGPSQRRVKVVRGIAVVVALSSLVGVFVHVTGNYEAGPLDYRYMETWGTMSETARWWAAISKTVGPAPPIAPGVLAQAALAVLFATVRHPALRRS